MRALLIWAVCGWTIADRATAGQETATEIQRRLEDGLERVRPTFVRMWKDEQSMGGGVLVDPSGLVLSHGHHGDLPSTSYEAELADGRRVSATLTALTMWPMMDTSLWRLEGLGPWPCVPRHAVSPEAGARCFMLGIPLAAAQDEGPLLRLGRVVGRDGGAIVTSMRMSPGDSGSPLFDLEGRLLGVANRVLGGEAASSYYAGADVVFSQWDRLTTSYSLPVQTGLREVWTVSDWTPLVALSDSIVSFESGGRSWGRGFVVREDGCIATKASLVQRVDPEDVSVAFSNGQRAPVDHWVFDQEHDLCIVRVGRTGLRPVLWRDEPLRAAELVAAPLGGFAVAGVVTTGVVRDVALVPGTFGVEWEDVEAGARAFREARPEPPHGLVRLEREVTPAARVQPGDIVTAIEGRPVRGAADVASFLAVNAERPAGSVVELTRLRDGTSADERVILVTEADAGIGMEGDLSRRRSGFPAVIGHDVSVRATECGGPLCDVDGQVVGLLVARSERFESLTIPTEVVRPLIDGLLQTLDSDR